MLWSLDSEFREQHKRAIQEIVDRQMNEIDDAIAGLMCSGVSSDRITLARMADDDGLTQVLMIDGVARYEFSVTLSKSDGPDRNYLKDCPNYI